MLRNRLKGPNLSLQRSRDAGKKRNRIDMPSSVPTNYAPRLFADIGKQLSPPRGQAGLTGGGFNIASGFKS